MTDGDYEPFYKREEWSDVEPVLQDDGPKPVCVIAYNDQFKDTMNYFRAVLRSKEKSPRVLGLTKEVIALNTANYTAWYYRRLTISALNADLKEELEWTTELGKGNPKNYQVWHHRQWVVQQGAGTEQELEFTAEMIVDDSKNYHAWAHRQFIIQTFNLWEKELEYIDQLFETDIRNNSAWNQRFFVVSNEITAENENEIKSREIDYAIKFIKRAPNNQSPWNYLSGVVKRLGSESKYNQFENIKENCIEFKQKYPSCPHSLSLLVDIFEEENFFEEAQQLCSELSTKNDTIHKKYWDYRSQLIKGN